MSRTTDDVRIASIYPIPTPLDIMAETPRTDDVYDLVSFTRTRVHNILHHLDDRLIVVVGPCSIHDPEAAMDYANRLMALREELSDDLEILMRVYFEKPRTTIGWKGLINDPDLDGSFNITKGLKVARRLLHDINALGLPAACEFLDMTTPQYIADLVSWGAIGARTTESQVHRELASGSSCAIGFKNGTSGDVKIAIDAVGAASHPHHFLAVTKSGEAAIAATRGNEDSHIILRGGTAGTNYDARSIDNAAAALEKAGLAQSIMIDASHANSSKDHNRQPLVLEEVGQQIAGGDKRIVGVMIESNLVGGRQDLKPGSGLTYGQSITDACIDWDSTKQILAGLAENVAKRRAA
ncbi:MAG: 3-deoxy-7-phosphoheptulonate synthase [Hyphomicrobiaceae bacterium]|nr:3-deoxy-7-phosphoheptulonate synthase [Hyphomicrobiaceae bacterium]MCC0025095.1 3-deoxy-7-phosphoheptulonate synthase [Hyphomicrobiaceae bacterium]